MLIVQREGEELAGIAGWGGGRGEELAGIARQDSLTLSRSICPLVSLVRDVRNQEVIVDSLGRRRQMPRHRVLGTLLGGENEGEGRSRMAVM